MDNSDFEIGDLVECTRFHNSPMADGSFEPCFYKHSGEILSIKDGKFEVHGPGGEQSTIVGKECLKLIRKAKTGS